MVFRIGVTVVCLFAMGFGTAFAADVLSCELQSADRKRREYRCPLTAKGSEQQLRFKADFTGSHDDTQLSMSLTLDGVPVICSRDSKTWLNGEDGNVSLDCNIALNGSVGTKQILGATVNIWHAELVVVELSTL